MPDDIPQDNTDGSRWMTYSELGQTRGISRASAERLARRNRWPKRAGNDGFARTLVPAAWTCLADDSPDITGRRTDALATLRVAVEMLRERLTVADNRGDKAEARVQELTAELVRATGDVRALQETTTRARAASLEAHDALAQMQAADAARRSRGRWARLRAAWRGQ